MICVESHGRGTQLAFIFDCRKNFADLLENDIMVISVSLSLSQHLTRHGSRC